MGKGKHYGQNKLWSVELTDDHSGTGVVRYKTCGEDLAFGAVVYQKSDAKMWKADADAWASMPAVAICIEAASADATGLFLYWGWVRDDTWNWTVGAKLYVSATAGALTETAPGSAKFNQIAAIAETADIIAFTEKTVVEGA